jgi:sorbitol-specific phosphotransferase system component IIBC
MKIEYNSLLIASVILLGVGQTLEGMTTPTARFLHGFLVVLSIVCSVLGLVLYARASTKKS